MLPNFLCVGAQKAGTTTLWHLLNAHPDIFMSQQRETRFFIDEHIYSRGIVNYELNHFSGWNGQKMIGEKTPEYLFHEKAAERIKKDLGEDTKIIIALRSPAKRLFSQYRHNFMNRTESLSFDAILEKEEQRVSGGDFNILSLYAYQSRSKYFEQVHRYIDIFPRKNLLILIFEEDIIQDQDKLTKRLYEFLEVDTNINISQKVSEGRASVADYLIVETGQSIKADNGKVFTGPLLLYGMAPNFSMIRKPSHQLTKYVQKAMENNPKDEKLEKEKEIELNNTVFKKDIEKLSELIGRDLSGWL